MRSVVQRVSHAKVLVEGEVVGSIGHGLCALVGVGTGDRIEDAEILANKLVGLRIFGDSEGKMNASLWDVGGELLVVSQFTLFGDVRRGRRPSFTSAMEPEAAAKLIDHLCDSARTLGVPVRTGRFRAEMKVELVNEGPVTLLIDTKKLF